MIRKDNVLEVEHLGGGKGTAYVHHIVSKEELLGHGRLYAKVVLPPGASVGWHQHVRLYCPVTFPASAAFRNHFAASESSASTPSPVKYMYPN